jgi:hypothetical protein
VWCVVTVAAMRKSPPYGSAEFEDEPVGVPEASGADVALLLVAEPHMDGMGVMGIGMADNMPDADELARLEAAELAAAEAQALANEQALKGLGQRVLSELHRRKGLRRDIEQRWHADIRRYNGVYEPAVLNAIKSRGYGSTAFVPLASRVINIVEARLTDMLFPSDERNFAVTATPTPELGELESVLQKMDPAKPLPGGGTAESLRQASKSLRAEHKAAADAMTREIDDQLRESNYAAHARSAIRDALIMGLGVLKGPTLVNRVKRVWRPDESGRWSLQIIEDTSPGVCWVDPWSFYPDPGVADVLDATPIELHYMQPHELRALARLPGFDLDAIREVLKVKPGRMTDDNREQLREASGTIGAGVNGYEIAEFHGPVELDEAIALGLPVPLMEDGEPDPLAEFHAVLFVAEGGQVIKGELTPMPSAEHPYSCFNWRKDPGSVYGFGLSYDLADMSDLACQTFRAAIDNMGLAVGPQIVINKGVSPINGQRVIEPNKLWEMDDEAGSVKDAFGFFQIDSQVQPLMTLFGTVKGLIDEVSGSQLAMMGQEAPSFMDTARGASMAYNASNIWMRRAVRLYDDQVTAPLIGRFVDWNMEFNPKEDIKGDLHATARGTSALLEAEMQAQKMAAFIELNKDIPMSLANKVQQRREFAKAMRLDTGDLLPTAEEIPELEKKLAEQQAPPNPELERIRIREMDLQDRAAEREHEMALESARNDLRIAEMAAKEQLSVQQIRAKYELDRDKMVANLQDRREARAQEAQRFNAEAIIKQRMGSGF